MRFMRTLADICDATLRRGAGQEAPAVVVLNGAPAPSSFGGAEAVGKSLHKHCLALSGRFIAADGTAVDYNGMAASQEFDDYRGLAASQKRGGASI